MVNPVEPLYKVKLVVVWGIFWPIHRILGQFGIAKGNLVGKHVCVVFIQR